MVEEGRGGERSERNAVIVSSTESNREAAFMSERVEEGIAAVNSVFSGRRKCIYPTVPAPDYENMDSSGEFLRGN